MHDSHFGHTNGNHRQQQVEENGSIMNQFTSSSLPPSLAAALLPQTVGHAFEQQQNIPQRDPQRQNSTVVPAVLPQQSSASPPTSGNYTFVDVQKEGGGIKYNAACAGLFIYFFIVSYKTYHILRVSQGTQTMLQNISMYEMR